MLRARRIWFVALLAVATALPAGGETPADFPARRAEAEALAQKNDPRAEALLRQLVREAPDDSWLSFRYGYGLLIRATALKPGSTRTALIKEGRSYLLKAKAAGLEQPLIDSALANFHEDGSIAQGIAFSAIGKADDCIKAAEKAFAVGKFDEALRHYREALEVEPGNFAATLYIGDVYFATDRLADAIIWYDKAIELRPEAETPYRYRADAQRKLGRDREALDSYIAAVVAEPNNPLTWHNLKGPALGMGYAVRYRAVPLPKAEITLNEKGAQIGLPPDAGVLTVAYAGARAKWVDDHRAALFPAGTKYRQTLAEETEALLMLLKVADDFRQNHTAPDKEMVASEAALKDLKAIAAAGLLAPHILFLRSNADLAQDYAAYRRDNRAQLSAYLHRFYLGEEQAP